MVDNSERQYSKVSSQERLSQIKDVFNENPELANAVYEILGFKTLSENEVTIEKIGKDRFKITATNKTWKNIAQGRKKIWVL